MGRIAFLSTAKKIMEFCNVLRVRKERNYLLINRLKWMKIQGGILLSRDKGMDRSFGLRIKRVIF
jgi:hypothetical protein